MRCEPFSERIRTSSPTTGEGDEAALAGGVDRLARRADARRVGGDVDDPSRLSRGHARKHRVMHVERAGEVDRDQLLPLRRLRLDERPEHVPAGVVDQDVDRAEPGLGRGDRGGDLRPVGDVAEEGFGGEACGRDAGRDLARRIEVEVEHRDLGAFRGKAARRRPADPAPAASDHDDLACEPNHAARPPCGLGIAAVATLGQHLDYSAFICGNMLSYIPVGRARRKRKNERKIWHRRR